MSPIDGDNNAYKKPVDVPSTSPILRENIELILMPKKAIRLILGNMLTNKFSETSNNPLKTSDKMKSV